VIRSRVRNAKPVDTGHFSVYLPAYSDERIIKVLGEIKYQLEYSASIVKNTRKEHSHQTGK
jgi:hypothetical protein